jgi:hypothetical protein
LALVDNSDAVASRSITGRMAADFVKSGGWLVLDNYARYNRQFLAGWAITVFDDPHWSGKGTLIASSP